MKLADAMTNDEFVFWHLALFDRDATERTCKRGHPWWKYGIAITVNGRDAERCHECRRITARAYARRKKAIQ